MKGTWQQIIRFMMVGSVVSLIDSITYVLFLLLKFPIPIAKACGFINAVIFAYNFHRRWTFSVIHTSKTQVVLFFSLYLVNLIVNVITNSLLLDLFGTSVWGLIFSFLGATILCSIINFMGQKFVVFRVPGLRAEPERKKKPHSSKSRS